MLIRGGKQLFFYCLSDDPGARTMEIDTNMYNEGSVWDECIPTKPVFRHLGAMDVSALKKHTDVVRGK